MLSIVFSVVRDNPHIDTTRLKQLARAIAKERGVVTEPWSPKRAIEVLERRGEIARSVDNRWDSSQRRWAVSAEREARAAAKMARPIRASSLQPKRR